MTYQELSHKYNLPVEVIREIVREIRSRPRTITKQEQEQILEVIQNVSRETLKGKKHNE